MCFRRHGRSWSRACVDQTEKFARALFALLCDCNKGFCKSALFLMSKVVADVKILGFLDRVRSAHVLQRASMS